MNLMNHYRNLFKTKAFFSFPVCSFIIQNYQAFFHPILGGISQQSSLRNMGAYTIPNTEKKAFHNPGGKQINKAINVLTNKKRKKLWTTLLPCPLLAPPGRKQGVRERFKEPGDSTTTITIIMVTTVAVI